MSHMNFKKIRYNKAEFIFKSVNEGYQRSKKSKLRLSNQELKDDCNCLTGIRILSVKPGLWIRILPVKSGLRIRILPVKPGSWIQIRP